MNSFFGCIPFLTVGLWIIGFYAMSAPETRSWRWAIAQSAILLALSSLLITETLSLFHALHWSTLLLAWSAIAIVGLAVIIQKKQSLSFSEIRSRLFLALKAAPVWAAILFTCAVLLVVTMACVTPPLNFDVQIYHLPRQVFWKFNGSVEAFDASNSHQLSMPVLSEFIGLQFMALAGGDMWHNLIQSFYFIAIICVIGLIVHELGGTARASLYACLFLVFTPVVFFEASNSKNDLIVAFFVIVPVYLALRIWNGSLPPTFKIILLAALCAGLAVATKGTAIAYLPPAGLFFVAAIIKKNGIKLLACAMIPGLFLALAPPAPQMIRNWQEFDSPAGPNLHHTNASLKPKDIAGVAIRNIAGQLTTGFEGWNTHLEQTTRGLMHVLGMDPDNPHTSFEGGGFSLPYHPGLEDIVPAPIQTTIVLLLPAAFLWPAYRKKPGIIPLYLVIVGTLLLFCIIFRWQPWQGRLLIPAYVLAAPLAGMWLGSLRQRWVPICLMLAMLATLQPHLTYAGQRPLLGGGSIFRNSKTDQMSRTLPGRADEIKRMTEFLNAKNINQIMVDGGSTEIHGLLRELAVKIKNPSITSGHWDTPTVAEAIIKPSLPYAGVIPPPADKSPKSPPGYAPAWIGDYYQVFVSKNQKKTAPVFAAHFMGFAEEKGLSPNWFIGGNLQNYGREINSDEVLFKSLHSGKLDFKIFSIPGNQLSIEQNGKESAVFSFFTNDLTVSIDVISGETIKIKSAERPAWIKQIILAE
jgi:hypothetical protein